MSKRSYTACYLHLIWGTHQHVSLLNSKESRDAVTKYLKDYLKGKKIRPIAIYVNADHVHLLINLPADITIEDIVKLCKGSSSHWINQTDIIKSKFSWATGYAAFTVSRSILEKVRTYIQNQKEHHRIKTFAEEYEKFIQLHGIKLEDD